MRAYVRYYLKYSPDVISNMSMKELAEAFMDVMFVRGKEKPIYAGD